MINLCSTKISAFAEAWAVAPRCTKYILIKRNTFGSRFPTCHASSRRCHRSHLLPRKKKHDFVPLAWCANCRVAFVLMDKLIFARLLISANCGIFHVRMERPKKRRWKLMVFAWYKKLPESLSQPFSISISGSFWIEKFNCAWISFRRRPTCDTFRACKFSSLYLSSLHTQQRRCKANQNCDVYRVTKLMSLPRRLFALIGRDYRDCGSECIEHFST